MRNIRCVESRVDPLLHARVQNADSREGFPWSELANEEFGLSSTLTVRVKFRKLRRA